MSEHIADSFENMSVEELYERLKPIARNLMRGLSPTHTFGQATALVDEVLLRMKRYFPELATSPSARRAVARQAAKAMRRILIDHHKHHHRQKRTGNHQRVDLTLVDGAGRTTRSPVDLIALDDAMDELASADPLAAEVVDKRFFGGMTMSEIAEEVGVSSNDVEAAWIRAKTWLAEQLRQDD